MYSSSKSGSNQGGQNYSSSKSSGGNYSSSQSQNSQQTYQSTQGGFNYQPAPVFGSGSPNISTTTSRQNFLTGDYRTNTTPVRDELDSSSCRLM